MLNMKFVKFSREIYLNSLVMFIISILKIILILTDFPNNILKFKQIFRNMNLL